MVEFGNMGFDRRAVRLTQVSLPRILHALLKTDHSREHILCCGTAVELAGFRNVPFGSDDVLDRFRESIGVERAFYLNGGDHRLWTHDYEVNHREQRDEHLSVVHQDVDFRGSLDTALRSPHSMNVSLANQE